MPEDDIPDEDQEDSGQETYSLELTKSEFIAISLLQREGETLKDTIMRVIQENMEYGAMKDILQTIDGRISDLSKKYKLSQSSIINFKYDVQEGLRIPEELRSSDDKAKKPEALKLQLEKKWAELEKGRK
ncbi:MAG: hypothetical protein M1616_02810 [Candidatus Thermoplasmatota archaeon]|jgi:hypothetical protein|nr:hypothetical protein [Candidatus Thermoplasmatota archaeon]